MERKIGMLSVDAGLMMLGDPCYVIGREIGKLDWREFLSRYADNHNDQVMQIEKGTAIMFQTGYGDGSYPVFAKIEDGIVKSVTVVFDNSRDDE